MKFSYVLVISCWVGLLHTSSSYGMERLSAGDSNSISQVAEELGDWALFISEAGLFPAPPGRECAVYPIVSFSRVDCVTMCEEYSSASEERKEEIKRQLLSCGYELLETADGGVELQPTLNKAMRSYAIDLENRDVYDAVLKKHGLKAQETSHGRFCFMAHREIES